jgi:RNA-directed DNA polymerase
MWRVRHDRIGDQVREINAALRGHYAYYGVAGNIRALFRAYRVTERYWHRMLCSRSWATSRMTWDIKRTPLLRPKLRLPRRELQARAVL